jgi:hypothetical protein
MLFRIKDELALKTKVEYDGPFSAAFAQSKSQQNKTQIIGVVVEGSGTQQTSCGTLDRIAGLCKVITGPFALFLCFARNVSI